MAVAKTECNPASPWCGEVVELHERKGELTIAVILIIDDSAFQHKRIREAVNAVGYATLEAANGAEGLEVAKAHDLDCILTDLLMPVMDGIEVLENLRDRGSQVPVIVITADIQDSTAEQCCPLGAKAILNKPPEPDELCNVLHDVLGLNQGATL